MTQHFESPIRDVLLLHHSHLDVGYTHSQPMLWELQNEYISQAIDWLEETAGLPEGARPKWTCEVTEPVRRWLRRASGADVQRFRKLHSQGRMGIGAMRWNTAAAVDRSGLQRLLDGKEELEQLLEAPIRVACQHDVNGVPWPMADALLDADVDLFVMAVNPHLGKSIAPRPGMFLWETPSGRTLRVFNGNHYTMFDQLLYAWDDSVDRMAEGWSELEARLQATQYDLDFVYLTSTCSPTMWDNAPPNPFMPDLIGRWNEAGLGPRVQYATFEDLRERALSVPDSELQVLRGDWTDYWSFGYGSTPRETARNQQAKPLIQAARAMSPSAPHPMLLSAEDKADLFDEHTWGYFNPDPSHPQAQATEHLKTAAAHESHEFAAFAAMDGMERLAGNPLADKGVKAVLLCNPGQHDIVVRPELPQAWLEPAKPSRERTYRASRMFFEGRSWEPRNQGGGRQAFGPVSLPASSWQIVPLQDLPAAPAVSATTHEIETTSVERRELNFAPATSREARIGRLESPFHRLRYNADTGRIFSLTDLRTGREILDQGSQFDFFAFVRERPDALIDNSRYAYYERDLDKEKNDQSCWKEWAGVRESATKVLGIEAVSGAGCVTLERRLQAPGMIDLVQRITLFEDDPVIKLEVDMELSPEPSPQGIYFAFPLAMAAGWGAKFDTAGQEVNVDDDQLPGACRNWATTESMAAMWDAEGAVGLLTPDGPMVQFGGFHFGPPLDSLPRPKNPLLLAWPVNNYWNTNYPLVQAGPFSLRYGIVTLGSDDVDAMKDHANRFRQPRLLWPVTGGGYGPGTGTLGPSAIP